MTASYPTSVKPFTPKVDLQDTVIADHVNALQLEVAAVETTLGVTLSSSDGPLISTWSGTFARTTAWDSLTHRINNIESGLVNGVVGSPYLQKSGDTINPAGVVGVTLTAQSGTANLLEARPIGGATLNFNLDYTGLPKVGTANVLYVGSTDYNTLTTNISTATTTANSALSTANGAAAAVGTSLHPFLLMGV